jgi:hypothetical protein
MMIHQQFISHNFCFNLLDICLALMATIWESKLPFELQGDGSKEAKLAVEVSCRKSVRKVYGSQWGK